MKDNSSGRYKQSGCHTWSCNFLLNLRNYYVSCNMKTVFLAYWIVLFDSSICHLSPTNIALSFETEVKEPIGTTHNVIYHIYYSKAESVGSCRYQTHLCISASAMSSKNTQGTYDISTGSVFLIFKWMSSKQFDQFKVLSIWPNTEKLS